MALALRDECQDLIARTEHLIASDSILAAKIASQTKMITTGGIASAEFMITQADLNQNMQRLATELLYVRNRSLQLLTAKKDALTITRKAFQSRFLLTTLATSIAAFIALFFISHQIKLPTRKIMEIIRKIRDGNYSVPVRAHTGNEVDQIVAGLAGVADTLKIRDQLKIDKIQLEKKRFSAFANFVNAPLLMVNEEKKIAFANDELMTLFKLTWDELYEVDFAQAPLPVELRDKLTALMNEKKWVENEQCDIIGENYAFDLHLSLIPVKSADNPVASVIITLGKIDCRKRTVPSQRA
jgi:nitrogen fixation/metabolism regulation signal transduction histidine kinase